MKTEKELWKQRADFCRKMAQSKKRYCTTHNECNDGLCPMAWERAAELFDTIPQTLLDQTR
jgi:hypothetical protein